MDINDALTSPPTITMRGYKIIASLTICVFSVLIIVYAYFEKPGWAILCALILVSAIYVFLASGIYFVLDDHIVFKNYFGRYELYWKDVISLESSAGQLNIMSSKGRFVLFPSDPLARGENAPGWELVMQKLAETGLPIREATGGTFKFHKGVKHQ